MKLMKKVISIAIASLLSCSVLAASAQEREVLFEDNFDGSKKSSWTEFWGDWNFGGADGGLSVTTTAGKTLPKIITGLNQDWQHYEIEVDLEGVSNGGVIFRSNSPVEGADGFDGYYVGYDSKYAFFGIDQNGWKTINKGGALAGATRELKYKESMHWKIVVNGNAFTLYVDDMNKPFIQVYDSTYTKGGVGLRFLTQPGAKSGSFKNLKITRIPDDEVTYADESKGTFDIWAERLVSQNPPAENQDKIIMVGHSQLELWDNYAEDLAPLDVLNFGMGGSCVEHLVGKNDLLLTPYHPKAVIVMTGGGNDMSAGLNGTQTGNAAAEYLKSVRQSLPDTPIFVIEHCCSPVNANRYSQFITMNQIVKDFCATDDNIWFIETMGVIDYTDLSFYKDDQMHLNAKGYTALTSVLKPVIQSVLAGEPVPSNPSSDPGSTGNNGADGNNNGQNGGQNTSSSGPKTGDAFHGLAPWIIGFSCALAVCVGVAAVKGRSRRKDRGRG